LISARLLVKLTRRAEYEGVLRRAGEKHFLHHLIESHATLCTPEQAQAILDRLQRFCSMPETALIFGSRRGHAYAPNTRNRLPYRISLPRPETGRLRVGLVLHEAAHVFDHARRKKMGHGWGFIHALEPLLTSFNWRLDMPTRSFFEIYMRHRGPYSLVGSEGSKAERVQGPFNAEQAHAKAIAAVTTGKEESVFVYSDSEGSFIGAFYRRGDKFKTYAEEKNAYQAGLELSDQRDPAALLQGGPEPLRPVDDPVDERVQGGTVPGDRHVRSVPPQGPPEPRAKRTAPPAKRRVALCLGKDDDWPKSEAAQAVHDLFGTVNDRKALTSGEICEALGPRLTELGVQFPASLVSRLKQNGFLKEHIDG